LEYEVLEKGVISEGIISAISPRRKFDKLAFEILKESKFENVEKFSGKCFFITLQLDEKYFNKYTQNIHAKKTHETLK